MTDAFEKVKAEMEVISREKKVTEGKLKEL